MQVVAVDGLGVLLEGLFKVPFAKCCGTENAASQVRAGMWCCWENHGIVEGAFTCICRALEGFPRYKW